MLLSVLLARTSLPFPGKVVYQAALVMFTACMMATKTAGMRDWWRIWLPVVLTAKDHLRPRWLGQLGKAAENLSSRLLPAFSFIGREAATTILYGALSAHYISTTSCLLNAVQFQGSGHLLVSSFHLQYAIASLGVKSQTPAIGAAWQMCQFWPHIIPPVNINERRMHRKVNCYLSKHRKSQKEFQTLNQLSQFKINRACTLQSTSDSRSCEPPLDQLRDS